VGRPPVSSELAAFVRTLALANPLWCSPPIHGEWLKLGLEVSQRTVARLIPRRPKPPSQSWRTFLHNHLADLVSVDFFVVPTATFRVLYVFGVLLHHRRRVVHFNVTDPPPPARRSKSSKRFPMTRKRSERARATIWLPAAPSTCAPIQLGGPRHIRVYPISAMIDTTDQHSWVQPPGSSFGQR